MKCYNGSIRVFLSLCKRPVKLMIGATAYIRLLSRKEKTHYLILPFSLGDSAWALAYLKEYKIQHGYDHITIVCTKSVERICHFWEDTFDDLIRVSIKTIIGLLEIPHTAWGQYLYAFTHRDRITYALLACNMMYRNYHWNKVYGIHQFVRDLMFQIDPDSKIQYPIIPEKDIQGIIEKYDIKKGRAVLLNPFANSIKCDIFALFGKLAEQLKGEGYGVFTLVSCDKDAPVKGTRPLRCDLAEAYRLAEYCGTIIALRSGFLDLMVFAHCRIIAVVDMDYGPKDFYRLENWGVNPDCHTVEYDGNDTEGLQKIMDIMHLETKKG